MHNLSLRQARIAGTSGRVLAIATLLLWMPAAATASPRSWQPLVLSNARSLPLGEPPIDHLEVLAIHDGKIEPIPFQVDETSRDGLFVLPEGPEANADEGDGRLNGDDTLVVMVSDLGESRVRNSELPPGAVEIKVTDPLGGPVRYLYVAVVDSPRLSTRRYVRFDPKKDVIETDSYRAGLTNGLPTDFAPQSSMDTHGPNLIDRLKVRLSTFVLHLVRFSFSEGDIHTQVLAWKEGPVRVIRRLSHSVDLVLGLGSAEVLRHDIFYRDMMEDPFMMYLPWAPRLFFGDTRARIDLDFNDLHGYDLLWSGMTVPPVRMGDREMEAKIAQGAPIPISWMAVRGHGHLVVQTLFPTPGLAVLNRELYFNNDANRPDPPESTPGSIPVSVM